MPEIENCPECGGAPREGARYWEYWIVCPNCSLKSTSEMQYLDRPTEDERNKAIAAWNARAQSLVAARSSEASRIKSELQAICTELDDARKMASAWKKLARMWRFSSNGEAYRWNKWVYLENTKAIKPKNTGKNHG